MHVNPTNVELEVNAKSGGLLVDKLVGKLYDHWRQRQRARTHRPPVHDDQESDTPRWIKNFIYTEGSRQYEQLGGTRNGFITNPQN